MGQVDDFLRQHASSGLDPGESIPGMGLLRHPTKFNALMVPQHYENFLAVATDRRLIVFETEIGGIMTPTAKPVARNPIVWRYDELARVDTKPVEGMAVHSGGGGTVIGLIPHPFCGPFAQQQAPQAQAGVGRRYDLYAHIDGLDSQRALFQQFPQWLQQQVAAGAFPMAAERRAQVEARVAEARAAGAAEMERQRVARAERDARMQAGFGKVKPHLLHATLGLFALGALGFGAIGVTDEWGRLDYREPHRAWDVKKKVMLENDLKTWVPNLAVEPPNDCPEDTWGPPPHPFGRRCHDCSVNPQQQKEPLPRTWRQFPRGADFWICGDVASYQDSLRRATESVQSIDEMRENALSSVVQGFVAMGVGVLLAVGAVIAFVRRKKPAALT